MCGFFASNSSSIDDSLNSTVEKHLRFRGPDGSSGLISSNGWFSYHSRLSIIDLTEGTNQPVINSDGSQLVFNGEILNYKELGLKYFNKHYKSDTFLLNYLIVSSKLNLAELDGFFAFVFIDEKGELKYACRDKFGVKPLYYYKTKNEISFSSEPNLLIGLFSNSVNENAIEEYKVFRAPIFQGSFYHDIHQVDPGCCFVNGEYFSVEKELIASKKNKLLPTNSDLQNALHLGVESRCVSDAPIGLLLSKGVDSNLIRHTGSFDRLYTIGFDGDEDIEYLENQKIRDLKVRRVEANEFKEAFDYLLNLRKEPMSVPNEVLLYLIAKEAKNDGIKVLLSGEGADEFFGGYDRIFSWALKVDTFDLGEFLELYAYRKVARDSFLFNFLSDLFDNCSIKDPFEIVRWFFIRYHMPVLFRRLDFALMAAGVEGREPIANHHLFTVCKDMAGSDLMINTLGKRPLRELLSGYMGRDFSFEKKVGFPVDLTKIFDNPRELSSYELWFSKNLEVL
jgi:asparagine synthase (glutamine-hydrolysing)